MSYKVLQDRCIGCGACDYSCHTNALVKTDTFLGLFAIDPFTCDDCAVCVGKCPERAIVVDHQYATCHGHGCPLESSRLDGVECTIWSQTCPACGTALWREPGQALFSCPRCDSGRKVACPKTRFLGEVVRPVAHSNTGR